MQHHCEEPAAAIANLRNRGFEGKLFTIGAQPRKHLLMAHSQVGDAGGAKPSNMPRVGRPEAFRNEARKGSVERVHCANAKDAFGRWIELHDVLRFVHRDDGFHRQADDRRHARLVRILIGVRVGARGSRRDEQPDEDRDKG